MSNILRRQNRYGIRKCALDPSNDQDAFCGCYKDRPRVTSCNCGESGRVLEWVWDIGMKSNCTHLVNENKDVRFHLHFSGGTAVIRGNCPITDNQHYWEVKMTSLVYGTDMMVGIGTKDADIHKVSDKFCSVLGIDSETWGLSYTGLFHHEGVSRVYASGFGQGSIIGVHLDMWNGTLSFYKNRQPLGIACSGLKGKTLYPMVSSTAARSGMRIIHSISFPSSLQFLCCVVLRKCISPDKSVLQSVSMPPGMKTFLANNLGWLLGEDRFSPERDETPHLQKSQIPYGCCEGRGLSNRSTCPHKNLTCIDCNTPVIPFPDDHNIGLTSNQPSSSRNFVLVGSSIVLQNVNRFHPDISNTRREMTGSNGSNAETCGSGSKKMKYSYHYAMGLETDSDTSD